jgi:hypothetical protein
MDNPCSLYEKKCLTTLHKAVSIQNMHVPMHRDGHNFIAVFIQLGFSSVLSLRAGLQKVQRLSNELDAF